MKNLRLGLWTPLALVALTSLPVQAAGVLAREDLDLSLPDGTVLPGEPGNPELNFSPDVTLAADVALEPEAAELETPMFSPDRSAPLEVAQVPPSNTIPGVLPPGNPALPSAPSVPNVPVMVPNPEVIIRSNGTGNPDILSPTVPVAPVQPRAVAPPVGDMAISNINTTYDVINLGPSGNVIIPRLVLRQAPVREVLLVLARYAGMNIIFSVNEGEAPAGGAAAAPAPGGAAAQPGALSNVSLDLENEPVQQVFNSVLMVSGLKANRRGNTIFVGPDLPPQAMNLISRTIRLNQVKSFNAGVTLSAQGAEFQRLVTKTEDIVDPLTGRVTGKREIPSQLEAIKPQGEGGPPLILTGLRVSTDDRLNSITLVGEPRQVEIATSLLTQLDARRRQVAVNVKIIDINLNNIQDYNSSFSFGVGDSYFVQDGGQAVMRFGQTSPVPRADIDSATGRISNPPAIANPFADSNTFIDFSSGTTIPGYGQGVFLTDDQGNAGFIAPRTDLEVYNRIAGVSNNPFVTGITELELPTDTLITRTFNPETGLFTTTVTRGTDGVATAGLPSYYQYPKNFSAQIFAQIRSGNAKILTDPTLMVQEGQQATVKLTQKVVESVDTQVDPLSGVRTTTPVLADAGLTVTVSVDQIDDNGYITLTVLPTVASPGATQSFESGPGSTNTLTLLNKRELSSGLVRLRDGQTFILTGIISEQQQTTTSKVPILGDIPVLGALFRSQTDTVDRSEVVVMLTPQIVHDNTEATFGYNYAPGKATSDYLRQQGFPVQALP
ncbi:MAG: secretin N-terminal domain-containing protein [Cyanobacteriota bacterium]|jgi:type IV pilus assembly protein PilQ